MLQPDGRPMTVKAVHEHKVQQMTLCTDAVFSSSASWRLGIGWDAKVASPEGLEPPTSDLEGRCSIQLSYGLKGVARMA